MNSFFHRHWPHQFAERSFLPLSGYQKEGRRRKLSTSNETDIQQVSDGVGRSLKALLHWCPCYRAGCQTERRILSRQPSCPEATARHVLVVTGRVFFVFQQDGAPAHRSHKTVGFLERKTPSFIPPTLWPTNSPDLNPVDYSICILQCATAECLQLQSSRRWWTQNTSDGRVGAV